MKPIAHPPQSLPRLLFRAAALCCLVALPFGAFAQSSEVISPEAPVPGAGQGSGDEGAFDPEYRPRSEDAASFHVLALGEIRERLYYRDSEGVWPVRLSRNSFGSKLWVDDVDELVLYRRVLEEGEVRLEPVVTVDLVGGTRYHLVALAPAVGEYRARAYDLSLRAQPLGTVRFINLAPFRTALRLEEEVFVLDPGADRVEPVDEDSEIIRVAVATIAEGERRRLFSSTYQMIPGFRLLLVGTLRTGSLDDEMPYTLLTRRDRGDR